MTRLIVSKQGFDFLAQSFITAADCIQEGGTFGQWHFDCLLKARAHTAGSCHTDLRQPMLADL
jgi:hypothetical protein